MHRDQNRNKEHGIVFLLLLVVFVLGIALGAFLMVKQAQNKKVPAAASKVVETSRKVLDLPGLAQ